MNSTFFFFKQKDVLNSHFFFFFILVYLFSGEEQHVLREGHGLWNLLGLHLSPSESLGHLLNFSESVSTKQKWKWCTRGSPWASLSGNTLGPVLIHDRHVRQSLLSFSLGANWSLAPESGEYGKGICYSVPSRAMLSGHINLGLKKKIKRKINRFLILSGYFSTPWCHLQSKIPSSQATQYFSDLRRVIHFPLLPRLN